MPLHYSAAHSSRITKPKTKNPLASNSRKKGSTPQKKAGQSRAHREGDEDEDDEFFSSRLEDHGLVKVLAIDLRLRDVAQQLRYIHDNMFDEIPERAGMNSTRITELLNYRKNLPPIITVAHVHALSRSPTTADREIAELVKAGVIRRIFIPGRGLGSAAIGESLVLSDLWIRKVGESADLDAQTKEKYVAALRANASRTRAPGGTFTAEEAVLLIKAGFLTAPTSTSMTTTASSYLLSPSSSNIGTLASLSTVGSRAAAGSVAAVGGDSAIYDAGGGGSSLSNLHAQQDSAGREGDGGVEYAFSLPSIGPYLRLLGASRAHVVQLLTKFKFKEAPKDLLKERWEGAPGAGAARRAKGLAAPVLPARTKKWRQFNGLKFQWVLEECLGTGLVEVFDTGSVGHGVRLTS